MGLLDFLKPKLASIQGKKPRDPRQNHDFTAEDTELAVEIRRSNAEIRKKKQELELSLLELKNEKEKVELQADIAEAKQILAEVNGEGSEEGSSEDLLLVELFKLLGGRKDSPLLQGPQDPGAGAVTAGSSPKYSDQDLRDYISRIPAGYREMAKKMPPDQLIELIKGLQPGMDQETIDRGIRILKENA